MARREEGEWLAIKLTSNAARRDGSAHQNGKLFLHEP